MKKVLVTGANSKIGTSICKMLLKKSFRVLAICHNKTDNIALVKNDNLEIKFLDLKNEKEIIELCEKLDVNILINCAAVNFDCDFNVKEKSDFMECFEVNVVAPFLLAKHLHNLENIINISSKDGIDTYNVISMDYCASKAALNNLTKTLALALPNTNVVALALGWVNVDNEINIDYLNSELKRTKQNRLIELSEINECVNKIINNNYETGSIIVLDGVDEYVY